MNSEVVLITNKHWLAQASCTHPFTKHTFGRIKKGENA